MAEFTMTCSSELSTTDQREFVCDVLSRSIPGWKEHFMSGGGLRSDVTLIREPTEIRLKR
jgi:hypothetical protein